MRYHEVRIPQGLPGRQSSVISDQLSVRKILNPELLSEVGMRLQEKYAEYLKIQEFREMLKLKDVNHNKLSVKTNNDSPITYNHEVLSS
jgi:hypothetical protein